MTPTALIRTAVALAVALLVSGALLAVTPASSSARSADGERAESGRMRCNPPNCFIAGAVNLKTGFAYQRWNQSSRAASRDAAIRQCKRETTEDKYDQDCRGAGYNRNGCLAIAYRANVDGLQEWAWAGADFQRGVGTKRTKAKAVRRAKRKASGPGKERVWIANCTAR